MEIDDELDEWEELSISDRSLSEPKEKFELDFHVQYEMLRYGMRHAPYEACGFVAGKEGKTTAFYPIWNDDLNDGESDIALVSYEMNPDDEFRALRDIHAKGLEVLAVFHTHPFGVPFPSMKDMSNGVWTEDVVYIIASFHDRMPDVRAWRFKENHQPRALRAHDYNAEEVELLIS